ncbi:GlxA family transcriptional regulator [Streptosporangium roseum]|uniref:GlxA family transcriptional regulator n=1 Tax=Streptosporangium roseum TaxID=2001 RepID=UPI0004CDCD23|nr:helix-turn-helix domain-containing protein [Streptosporangium roseum]
MHRIVVLALDGVIPFELGIPARVFGVARGPDREPLYEVITCTVDGRSVRTDADFSIAVGHGAEALATADTVVIPATHALGQISTEGRLPEPLARAIARIRPGTRLVSICTAAYVLAAAGLLDGRPATTHWSSAEHFQKRFPQVNVNPNVLFVDDGDVLTSAGVAAGVDLCLHIVRRDHGSEAANHVARRCVVPPWRDGGQAQFIERPIPERSTATTSATRAWALERLHLPLPLTELADHARMSRRTFTRRFRDEMGVSPGQWLTLQRLELARRLLEASDLPVDGVAERAGFGTAASLRQHMQAAIGVSPMTYRRTFRSAEPDLTLVEA